MKVVIIGGTGLIGEKLATRINDKDCEVVSASRSKGVNTITGEGLAETLAGCQVVVDVSNSSAFDDKSVLAFFQTSGQNLLAAEKKAGVNHHVTLSVVGTHRLQQSGYFRAKLAQEELVKKSGVPYTLVRSTQFFEFFGIIADSASRGDSIQLPPVGFQPIAADDVAGYLAEIVTGNPVNGFLEIAGPERLGLAEFIQRYLIKKGDTRKVIANNDAPYFGTILSEQSLVTDNASHLGSTTFEEWLSRQPSGF
jgi:uncharacterized protein YbjT (DUF2867 family)